MLAVETNVLIYAHRRETAEHAAAAALLRELAEGPERWAIPWPCVYEFASVATNRENLESRREHPESGLGAATSLASLADLQSHRRDRWASSICSRTTFVCHAFTARWSTTLASRRSASPTGSRPYLTRDRDFSHFPHLTVRNPFAA